MDCALQLDQLVVGAVYREECTGMLEPACWKYFHLVPAILLANRVAARVQECGGQGAQGEVHPVQLGEARLMGGPHQAAEWRQEQARQGRRSAGAWQLRRDLHKR